MCIYSVSVVDPMGQIVGGFVPLLDGGCGESVMIGCKEVEGWEMNGMTRYLSWTNN